MSAKQGIDLIRAKQGATDGGNISLVPPSKTLGGSVVTGLSVYWTMTRIG